MSRMLLEAQNGRFIRRSSGHNDLEWQSPQMNNHWCLSPACRSQFEFVIRELVAPTHVMNVLVNGAYQADTPDVETLLPVAWNVPQLKKTPQKLTYSL